VNSAGSGPWRISRIEPAYCDAQSAGSSTSHRPGSSAAVVALSASSAPPIAVFGVVFGPPAGSAPDPSSAPHPTDDHPTSTVTATASPPHHPR
jgi:hypothetical protein